MALGLILIAACGSDASEDDGAGAADAGSGSGQGGDLVLTTSSTGGDQNSGSGGGACRGELEAIVRDFSEDHPDFQTFSGTMAFTGIVEDDLGTDGKPVYAHNGGTAQTTGPDASDQWYRDVPGVNEPFLISLQLVQGGNGASVFESDAFFPIDDRGFGNEGNPHNYHFTTELHAIFDYQGGEVFTFTGDDDLWLFINERLAIDLGGLHPELSATVDLDAMAGQLGIVVGERYQMDIFHAERRTSQSNFRIETTIECFEAVPPPE